MKKSLVIVSLFCFCFLFSGSAYSTITNKDFLDYKNSASKSEEKKEIYKRVIYSYLLGAADTYLSTNAILQLKGQKKLFCQPGELSLNVENFVIFADEQIQIEKKKGSYLDTTPLSATLLLRLEKVFPCN